ncbi:HlyD family secretion protein [Rhizobium halophytocola]|uniref:Membrane fusion protein (Multidrug efflux system) n=1 Tax=Rhizobium halophytocola TaxID=735519 RepID=A0ABS4DTL1_9HYPH|nr:HlyD family secretion protein [Rhizobium halophytocola]MBP1849021.1 membrane fusion protein (multidrug efflux system) [Rhizobium halophytocola]
MAGTQRNTAIRPVDNEDEAQADVQKPAETAREDAEAPQAPVVQAAAPEAAPTAPAKKKRSRLILPVIVLAALGGAGWYGYNWFTDYRFQISTDDAYIQGDIANISPKVSGYVATVAVVENQHVSKGDVLATLDDGDYKIAVEQAQASLKSAHLTIDRIDAQIKGGEASLDQARAQKEASVASRDLADLSLTRVTNLQKQKIAATSELDSAKSTLAQAKANVSAADATIASADAQIAVLKAQRAEAEASIRSAELSLQKAERDLSFTVLKAPYDGVVGNRSVQIGDLVSSGQRLMALVPTEDLYVAANFKETQIEGLVPGSKVKVVADAYEDHPIEGTVESISPASGSVFSLLPPENATGNFTKIIQRVPVRIALPKEALDSGRLRAGLSVVVDVDTRTAPKN